MLNFSANWLRLAVKTTMKQAAEIYETRLAVIENFLSHRRIDVDQKKNAE